MDTEAIKERAKQLIDRLSTDKAKLILGLIERFNEKEEEGATRGGEHTPGEIRRYEETSHAGYSIF